MYDDPRAILEAVSVLHDIGSLIRSSAHHKNSFHLIVPADLPGWSSRQIRAIATIAGYHLAPPGLEPKPRHVGFGALDEVDSQQVKTLSAILRGTDGFDRPHPQRVRSVQIRTENDAAWLEVEVPDGPGVEI